MTRLILVRHGETTWHAENRYAGTSDVSLSPVGVEQARRLAAWAVTAPLAAIWSSDLDRAQATAQWSADACSVDLHVDRRLRELDFGAGEGLTVAEMADRFPEALQAFRADPAAAPLPGGEYPGAAAERFTDCLDDLRQQYGGGSVLVVAHSTVIRLALCQLIGVPLSRYRQVFPILRNCALTELVLNDGYTALLEFNTPLERFYP
jgi:probable phosphoglycerate mutase